MDIHEMSNHMAIRVGEKVPDQYQKMTAAVCDHDKCGATFSIIHHQAFADATRATKQIDTLKAILRDEHVDTKFQDHVKEYELDEFD